MAAPAIFNPTPDDQDPEVNRDDVERERRERRKGREAFGRPAMTRRSWYVEKSTADNLAGLIDDLHFETRIPKHVIATALFDEAVASEERVRRLLLKRDRIAPK